MKKFMLLVASAFLAIALTACGSANPIQNPNQGNGARRELPLADKLLIGTLKLENTPNAVDAQQAEILLPLWQLYKSLNASNTTATQETDAVVGQIQAAMTGDQIQAIDGMNLTGRDIFTVMQDLGLAQAPQANAQGTPFPRGGSGNGGNGFGGNRGFNPGGGPGFGGQNLNPQQIATLQARRTQGSFGSQRLPTALLDALIKLLESKSAPTATMIPSMTPTPTEEIISTSTP